MPCFFLLAGLFALMAACQAPESPSTPSTVRVALCQTEVDPDPEVNFPRIEQALAEARKQGAELAVFPETCLFGWVNPLAHQHADPIPGPTTDRLASLARKYQMMLAVGLAERSGNKLFDSAVLLDSDGSLLLHHRKVNILTHLMDPPYAPGSGASQSVAETRFGRIGMLICADTFQEDLVGDMAANQPDLLLVPYGWAAPEQDWPQHGQNLHAWVSHTAKAVQAPVVGVDSTGTLRFGPWTGYPLGGQSVVCDAAGRKLGVLADRKPEVRVFSIDL
ncbi:MAG: carbon-nitrogen hydrolase family protein [Planctomycetota bacterium]|nr:MAG: carbon-nitrogen hydrolase family protein [Planctomycetota bacterium]